MTASHKNIYTALAAAQTEMGNVKKGSVNSHFRSRYADLADVTAAVVPVLASHGIATYFVIEDNAVVTVLTHGETDTSIRCAVPLIVSKNDFQGLGSALTYCRRYGLMAISGVASEDDDGNAAAAAAPKQQPHVVTGPSAEAIERAKDKLRACETIDDLREAFIEMKATQPAIARLDEIIALKDNVKASISVEVEAAQ